MHIRNFCRRTRWFRLGAVLLMLVSCVSTSSLQSIEVSYRPLTADSAGAGSEHEWLAMDAAEFGGAVQVWIQTPRCGRVGVLLDGDAMMPGPVKVGPELPLRIELDSTELADGSHALTVIAADCRPQTERSRTISFTTNNEVTTPDTGPEPEELPQPSPDPEEDPDPQPDPEPGSEPEEPEPEPDPEPEPGPEPEPPTTGNVTADWYVATTGSDTQDGKSRSRAFATINKASEVARPGDVVLVAAGTYRGKVTTRASGSASDRITYLSEEVYGARIDARGEYTAWDNFGANVDIIGFEVFGSDYVGIFSRASRVRVIGNWVHDLAAPTCNEGNGGAAIVHGNYEAIGSETLGNIVHGVNPKGGYCNLIHGIYHSQVGGKIQNNIVFDIMARGIQRWHAANAVTITNNLIYETDTGIIVGANDSNGAGYVVANNILLDNRIGIRESGSNFESNLYTHNLMYENDWDYLMVSGEPVFTLTADPRFVDFRKDGTGDYRLRPDSPAIDAGIAINSPSHDFAGVARPQLSAVDIGPYEFQLDDLISAPLASRSY